MGVGSKVVSLDSESNSVCSTHVLDNIYRDVIVQRSTCPLSPMARKRFKEELETVGRPPECASLHLQ